MEKPFESMEGREEIKDTVLYWEAVKNGVARVAQNVPKCTGELLQGEHLVPTPCVPEPSAE